MIPFLLSASALAAGLHAGVPVRGVPGLGEPDFLSPELGWSAPVLSAEGQPRGMVRVFVGKAELDAQLWLRDAVLAVQTPLVPVVGLGDQALGSSSVMAVRDGNVGVFVALHEGSAREVSLTLLNAIVEQPSAWPAAPRVELKGDLWMVDAPGAAHLDAIGGRRPLGEAYGFSRVPEQVIAWDATGRASVWTP